MKLIAQLILGLIFICLALFMCNKLTCTSHHPKPQTQLLDSLTKIQHIQNQHLQILQAEKAQAYHLADSILAINTQLVSIKTLMPKRKSISEGHQCPSVKGKVCIDTNLYDSIQTICSQKEQLLNQSLAIIQQLKTNDSLQTIANTIKDSATTATIAQLRDINVPQSKPKRFSVNLSGGYGYTWGATTPSPQIGLTVGLKLFSF